MNIYMIFTSFLKLNLHLGLFLFFWFIRDNRASNAVNLTDGLDGLATVPVMLVALLSHLFIRSRKYNFFLISASVLRCLELQFLDQLLCLSSFLWYNAPPAKIFNGRHRITFRGSLAAIAIIVKHEIALAIIEDFFLETVSVIIQVISQVNR